MSDLADQLRALALDGACRTVVRHLEAAGHAVILLKGRAIAEWLYTDPSERTYQDLDILVSPASRGEVITSLVAIGYRSLIDDRMLATYSVEESPLVNDDGLAIDLHTGLKGVRLPQAEAWELLDSSTVPWDWAGTRVRVLDTPARAMHLALHLAQRGLVDTRAARDLVLGLDMVDRPTWQRAAQLATRLDALGAFAAGLSLLPAGAALLDDLGLSPGSQLETWLRAGSASTSAVLLEQALTATSWAQRLRIIRGRLFPSAQWLRVYEPDATGTPGGLLRTRLKRPLQVLLRLPAVFLERRAFLRSMPR